jgi:hypothetical protein
MTADFGGDEDLALAAFEAQRPPDGSACILGPVDSAQELGMLGAAFLPGQLEERETMTAADAAAAPGKVQAKLAGLASSPSGSAV